MRVDDAACQAVVDGQHARAVGQLARDGLRLVERGVGLRYRLAQRRQRALEHVGVDVLRPQQAHDRLALDAREGARLGQPRAQRRPPRVGQRVVGARARAPRRALGVQEPQAGEALGLRVPLAGRRRPDRVLALAHHPHEDVSARAALADEDEVGERERGELRR